MRKGCSAALWLIPPLRGNMTSNRRGEESSGEVWSHTTSDVLEGKGCPGGEVLVFPALPIARHPELSAW